MKHLKVIWLWSLALCLALALAACQGEDVGGSTSGGVGGSGTASDTVTITGKVVVNIEVQSAATTTVATPRYLLAIPANGDTEKVSLDSTGSFTVTLKKGTSYLLSILSDTSAFMANVEFGSGPQLVTGYVTTSPVDLGTITYTGQTKASAANDPMLSGTLRGGRNSNLMVDLDMDGVPDIARLVTSADVTIANGIANMVNDRQRPTTPSLRTSAISNDKIYLEWSPATDNVAVLNYRIYRNGALVTSSTQPYLYDMGLTAVTTYCYRVSAMDAAGNEGSQSTQSCSTTKDYPDSTAPSTPQGLTTTALSSTMVSLAWLASTDNQGIDFYRIYRDSSLLGTAEFTSYVDGTAPAGTNLCYRVSAVDREGNEGARSQASCVVTPFDNTGTQPQPPSRPTPPPTTGSTNTCDADTSAPSAIIAAATSGHDYPQTIFISWSGGTDVNFQQFSIYRAPYTTGTLVFDTLPIYQTTLTSYADNWLPPASAEMPADATTTPDPAYCYKVVSEDACGHTTTSNVDCAKPHPYYAPSLESCVRDYLNSLDPAFNVDEDEVTPAMLPGIQTLDCRTIDPPLPDPAVPDVTTLFNLGDLVNLEYLDISDNVGITDFSGVTNLKKLKELYMDDTEISGIEFLIGSTAPLERLSFQNCYVTDITMLRDFPTLLFLDFSNNLVSVVNDTSILPNTCYLPTSLQELYVASNLLSNIATFSTLTNLSIVDITGNCIADVSPVAGVPTVIGAAGQLPVCAP